jgi:uncharacterized protein
MKFRKTEDVYIVRLDTGERIIETLTAFCARENIRAASISGVGTCVGTVLGHLNWETKTHRQRPLEGHFEITSLLGNVSILDGKPLVHLHVTLAEEETSRAFSGHLHEAEIRATGEIFITTLAGELPRRKDPATGLNLLEP